MVQSKLCDVVYDETTEIHDDDDEIECNTYTMSFPSIDNVQRIFVFGNKKHDYEHTSNKIKEQHKLYSAIVKFPDDDNDYTSNSEMKLKLFKTYKNNT